MRPRAPDKMMKKSMAKFEVNNKKNKAIGFVKRRSSPHCEAVVRLRVVKPFSPLFRSSFAGRGSGPLETEKKLKVQYWSILL